MLANPLKTPALVSLDNQTGALEFWPIHPGGSRNPRTISLGIGITNEYGMVSNGSLVAIASHFPAEVVTYDVRTKVEMIYPDPYGSPVDIAVAKGDSLYVLNANSVAAYPYDRSAWREMTCQYIDNAVAIAVDDQSDIFINGYGPGSFMGVVEFPVGSQKCRKLNLQPELGAAAGWGSIPRPTT